MEKGKEIQKNKDGKDLMTLNGKLPWLQVWQSLTISTKETAVEVVKIPSPQLHVLGLNEAANRNEGYLLFLAQIISIVKFFGADWDADMGREAAELAYQEHNYLTVAEVKYFINRIKCGKYPSNKNFSPAIFMECLNSFANEIIATRGAVNSYDWKTNRVPDELFEVTPDPLTGAVVPADPDAVKEAIKALTIQIQEFEAIQRAKDEEARKAKWKALKDHRNKTIIDFVNHEIKAGHKVETGLMKIYYEAVDRLAGK